MTIKKTSKFCYGVKRVNRIWPTYAITLGSRQHISGGRRKENCQGDQYRWAKFCYTFQNFDSSAQVPAYVGQILLYFFIV